MKLGANDINAVKIGSTDVNKVYLGSNLVWEKSSPLLLDLYPNAAAAYSLRKLRTAYNGSAIEVRKTVATVTYIQDIGFVNGELDTAYLLSFAGSDDVFVAKWYDQSGQGNDATQSTASKQPAIVSSGVVNELNGKPTMTFSSPFLMDLNLSQYPFTSGGSATEKSIFAVAENDSTVNQNLYNIADTRDIYALTYNRSANNTYGFLGANYGTIGGNITGQNIISSLAISPSSKTFNNTVEGVSSNLVRANFSEVTIGSRGGSYAMDGNIQEMVMYELNQSANRAGIESNINSNYNMYWDGSQTGLLDDYSNASAAYSLRALNSAYTGAAIKVRRSSDNAEQDINLLYDGSLNTASLLSFVGSGDGFVTTWYDQSGGGNNVTQSSGSAQPQIVSSGSVVTTSGNYAIDFSGSTKTLVNATFDNSTQVSSVFTIAKSTSSAVQIITDGANSASRQVSGYYAGSPSVFAIYKGVTIKSTVPINTNINLLSTFFDVNSDLYLNGVQILNSVNPGSHTRQGFTLGSGINVAASFEGSIFEAIVFDGQNKSSDRLGIESNVNTHYTIY